MRLSIITVTWNAAEYIGQQIASVKAGAGEMAFEHIIVDNGSTDGTKDVVSQWSHIQLIQNKENLGFAAANNRGVEAATGEYVLFLNPDMTVAAGSLQTLVHWMEGKKQVGLASVRLEDEYGVLHADAVPRRFPTLRDQLAIVLKLARIFPGFVGHYMMNGFDETQEQVVDSVRGAFMLLRRETIDEIGFGFDPRYFVWFEDVDLCKEVQHLGLSVVYTPVISCVDHVGKAFNKQPLFPKQVRFARSMIAYFQKWHPWYQATLLAIAWAPVLGGAWIYSKVARV